MLQHVAAWTMSTTVALVVKSMMQSPLQGRMASADDQEQPLKPVCNS